MCLNPRTIRNPTQRIVIDGGQLLKMQVNCNKCAECLEARRNEWFIRTKFEIERTLATGGYVYFDTLTYDDNHLPKLSHYVDIDKYGLRDFSCFDKSHFKLFLKRLRRQLQYHHGVDKDAFRYFLTTEYGCDDRFTHRPHYHILFFVNCGVSPLSFSRLVGDCWQYGRTDGLPYKPSNYVQKHVYSAGNCSYKAVEAICMYVSKYINKSSTFTDKLENRKIYLRSAITKYNALHQQYITDDDEQFINDLCGNIDMFHRQSQCFGESYLYDLTPDKLMFLDINKVVVSDGKKIVSTYNLPMYYRRKLFYTLEKHPDGRRYWQLTDYGKKHLVNSKLKQIDKVATQYMDLVNNCDDDYLKGKVYQYLDGRSMQDYAIYELLYKGRHRHRDSIDYSKKQQFNYLNDEESNLFDWLLRVSQSSTPYLVGRSSAIDSSSEDIRVPLNSPSDRDDIMSYMHGHYPEMLNRSMRDSYVDYLNRYTFNEQSCPEFRHFDRLGVVLTLIKKPQNQNKEVTYRYLENLKEKYKILFNKNLN